MWLLTPLGCNSYQPEIVDFTPPTPCAKLSGWADHIGSVGESRGEVACSASPMGIGDRGSLHRLLHGGATYVRVDGCDNRGFESVSLPGVSGERAWGLARECISGWSDVPFPGKAGTINHDGTAVTVTSSANHWEWRLTGDMADVSNTVRIDVGFPDTTIAIASHGGSPF